MATSTPAPAAFGPLTLLARAASTALPVSLLLLVQRLGIAAVFFMS